MRCLVGLVLFVVLYLGSCSLLHKIVSKTSGRAAAAEALRKYHALVAVGVGAFTLFCCSVPTLLAKAAQRDFESVEAEWNR